MKANAQAAHQFVRTLCSTFQSGADSLLVWKCDTCNKRSEGFAFPYGRCMSCGGELDLVDPPAITDPVRDAIRVH